MRNVALAFELKKCFIYFISVNIRLKPVKMHEDAITLKALCLHIVYKPIKWNGTKWILTNYISFWRSKPQASTIDRCFSMENL